MKTSSTSRINFLFLLTLIIGASDAFAQTTSKFVDIRKPTYITELLSGPVGLYDSPELAFSAYQSWYTSTCTYPYACQASNLHPCADSFPENQDRYYWGYAGQWCHNYSVTYGGRPYSQGVTSYISISEGCPSGYSTVTVLASGTGAAGDPRHFENRCEKQKTTILPGTCPIGNPIYPSSGTKRQVEVDYTSASGSLKFVRRYDSDTGVFRNDFDPDFLPPVKGATSSCLTGNVTVWDQNSGGYRTLLRCFEELNPTSDVAFFTGIDGARQALSWNGSVGNSIPPYFKDRLSSISLNGSAGWMLYRQGENIVLVFDSNGKLQFTQEIGGPRVTLSRAAGRVISASDEGGRTLQLLYTDSGLVSALVDPDGRQVNYTYKAIAQSDAIPSASTSKPETVSFQDQSKKTYVWDEAALATGTTPGVNRLTGIVDQLSSRYASFSYVNGKAVSTEHSAGVDRYSMLDQRDVNGIGNIVLSFPSGATYTTAYASTNGFPRLVSDTQPAGSGCAAATTNITYDANGNVASKDDFNAHRTCYANDLSRNLEVTRVEGLPTTATCSTYTASGATLPAGTRKVSTQWHPDWRLETKIAEPGKLTTKVYNGQPDPFAAGAIAACAPASAVLPDGKPIVVLCRQVEQATTDTDGHLGFSAALQAGVPARQQTWTYNPYGQVLTARGPRTDIDDTTTYAYYPDTTADHTMGDLQSVTNAKGQVTQYPLYNKHGQVLRMMDANGVITDHAYDLRQRLTSTSVAGATTRYDYWPTGLLKRVTQPDSTYVDYTYDDAHRLIALSDNQGNRIDYTLDNAGNKIAEKVSDPGGTLTRQLSRAFDALGRVQQTTGRE